MDVPPDIDKLPSPPLGIGLREADISEMTVGKHYYDVSPYSTEVVKLLSKDIKFLSLKSIYRNIVQGGQPTWIEAYPDEEPIKHSLQNQNHTFYVPVEDIPAGGKRRKTRRRKAKRKTKKRNF